MKVLLDMNLSPAWVDTLRQAGFDTFHWSEVGDIRATDRKILDWSAARGQLARAAKQSGIEPRAIEHARELLSAAAEAFGWKVDVTLP